MSGDFNMTQFLQRLGIVGRQVDTSARAGLVDAGEQVLATGQRLCPVKTGALAGSGTLDDANADRGEVALGFNTGYAAIVHERRDVHHPQGQAGYLAAAIRQELPRINQILGTKIRDEGLR